MKTEAYKIIVKGLQIPIRLGCGEEERKNFQTAELDMEFEVDSKEVKELDKTVCYLTATQIAKKISKDKEWDLIENFLPALAKELFNNFPSAVLIDLELKKFVVPDTKYSGVRMVFNRGN